MGYRPLQRHGAGAAGAGVSDRTLKAVGVLVWLNFMVFLGVAFRLGGDAISGYHRSGHYYVGMHGGYRDVSHAVYIYSYVHAIVSMVSMAVFVLVAFLLRRRLSGFRAGR
jgi:hypothetical protein